MNEEKNSGVPLPAGVPISVEYNYQKNNPDEISVKDVKAKVPAFVKVSDVRFNKEDGTVNFKLKISWWGWPIIWFGLFWDWLRRSRGRKT